MIIKKGYRHDLITFFISTDELMTAMQVNYSIAFFSTSQHKKLADLKCNLIGVSFFKSVSGIISRTVMAIRVSWFSEEIPIIQQPATTCWAWSIHPLTIWLRIQISIHYLLLQRIMPCRTELQFLTASLSK